MVTASRANGRPSIHVVRPPSRRPHVLNSVRGCICDGEAGGFRQLYELSVIAQVNNGFSGLLRNQAALLNPRPARRARGWRGDHARRVVEQEDAPHGRPGRARPPPAVAALTSWSAVLPARIPSRVGLAGRRRYSPPVLARARHGVALARDGSFAVAHLRTAASPPARRGTPRSRSGAWRPRRGRC